MKHLIRARVTHDLNGPATVTTVLENAYEIQTESGVRMIALPQELRAATATPMKLRRPLMRRAGITVVRMTPDGTIASVKHPAATFAPLDPRSLRRTHRNCGEA